MKRLLVCIDGSDYSKSCCQHAAWMAQRSESEITVCYLTDIRKYEGPFIADLSGSLGLQPYGDIISQLRSIEERKAKSIEEMARQHLKDVGFHNEISFIHRTGLLADSIEELEESADIVVIGKRGENANFESEHLGSTMERVVRASRKPCLVASRAWKPIDKALLAWDASPSCRKALEHMARSQSMRGLEIHIASVPEGKDANAWKVSAEEAANTLKAAGLQPTVSILEGDVEESIAKCLEQVDADILIMGAYGHNRMRRLLIGSTTTTLMRECRTPCLCFR